MDTTSSILIGVISSLIASLIFWIAIPGIKKLGESIIKGFANRNKKFKDSIYKKAGKRRTDNNFDQGVIIIVTMTYTLLIWGLLAENISFETNYFNEDIDKLIIRIFALFLMIFFLLRWASRSIIKDIVQNFENKIDLIRPFVDDAEIYLLKRKWILMENYDDFKKIGERIKQIEKTAANNP